MIHDDTIKLLRECDAGVKMGIQAIDDVIEKVDGRKFYKMLDECRRQHSVLGREITDTLHKYHDEGKEPDIMSKGMSWMKTNMSLIADNSDGNIADLITDGCNMGIKSLSRYLNQYKAADDISKEYANRLIAMEDDLVKTARDYL